MDVMFVVVMSEVVMSEVVMSEVVMSGVITCDNAAPGGCDGGQDQPGD